MCINSIRTSVASFCVRNLPFSILKNKCFLCPLKHATLLLHFTFCGKMFHSVAVEESNNLHSYLTILFLFCISDVV